MVDCLTKQIIFIKNVDSSRISEVVLTKKILSFQLFDWKIFLFGCLSTLSHRVGVSPRFQSTVNIFKSRIYQFYTTVGTIHKLNFAILSCVLSSY